MILWFTALGFGIPCVIGIRSVAAGEGVPLVFGYPSYGAGPFEANGIPTTVPLLVGFLIVCILEGVAGWLLWRGERSGAALALALVPFGAVYWWGFALPYPPFLAAARTVLIVVGWNNLR